MTLSFLLLVLLISASCDKIEKSVTPKSDNDLVRETISEYFQAYFNRDFEKMVLLDSQLYGQVVSAVKAVPKQLQEQVLHEEVKKKIEEVRKQENRKSFLESYRSLFIIAYDNMQYEIMEIRDINDQLSGRLLKKMAFVKITYHSPDKAPKDWNTGKKVHQTIIKVYLYKWTNKIFKIDTYGIFNRGLKLFSNTSHNSGIGLNQSRVSSASRYRNTSSMGSGKNSTHPHYMTRIRIKRSVMSEGIDSEGHPSAIANTFATGSKKLYFCVEYSGAIAHKTKFLCKWFRDGQQIFTYSQIAKYANGWLWFWHKRYYTPGQYEVRFYTDGREIDRKSFTIQAT